MTSKVNLDTSSGEVEVEARHGSVHLGVFNPDIDGGDYADAYLTPEQARELAAALTIAAGRL